MEDWGSSETVTIPGYGWLGAVVVAIGFTLAFGGLGVAIGLALAAL